MKTEVMLVSICVLFGALGFLGFNHAAVLKSSLDASCGEILELKEDLSIARDNLRRVREMLDEAENELSSLKLELQMLQEGDRYTLHDPTYREVSNFVKEDKTDENEWVEGEYVCVDFAADFNKNAMKNGIRCAEVNITFEKGGHMIAAFDTVDRGLVYVEPQHDVIFQELEVGQEYWKIVEKYTPYKFIEEEDTIQRIVILW